MSGQRSTAPVARSAAAFFWVTLAACLGGLVTYWGTGLLDPEAGSAVGEDLFITLSPAVVVAGVLWLLLRRFPTGGPVARLLVLAVGWGLFLASR